MRHNINIIFKRRARDRISIMGCIESRDAGLVVFSLRLRPPCRRTSNYALCRIWNKTSKRGCSASTTTPRRSFLPFLFLFPSILRVVAFRVMDETRSRSLSFSLSLSLSLSLSSVLSSSQHEKEAISISCTHSGHVSFVPLHLRFPVSRARVGR